MFTIHADGELLYSTAADDAEHIVLNPKLSLDINAAGSLTFVLPPTHAMHGSLKRLKTIITMEQNGEEIFRGRVMDSERDYFNQISVTCEGEKSFLLDSLYEEGVFDGDAGDFFTQLIENHNAQVEESKRFLVGSITAIDGQVADPKIKIETRRFWDTSTVIEDRLLSVYGGYLKTRKEGNARYIDWVKEYGGTNEQAFTFSVNLLDLKEKISAEDVFTVLIPLGYSEMGSDGKYTDPVNITSENNGVKYIQNDEAVAQYGKIWRTQTWGQTKDPSVLMTKAKEYMKTGAALQTLTLSAIDMHIVDTEVSRIKLGDKVRIVSDPHGIDITLICSKIDIDPLNLERTQYTLGEKPRTLTEGVASTEKKTGGGGGGGGGSKTVEEEVHDILTWAEAHISNVNAEILLTTGLISNLDGRLNTAEIKINGALAEIELKASQQMVLDINNNVVQNAVDVANLTDRVVLAESTLVVHADQFSSTVNVNGVISAINQTVEAIMIQARRIDLSGYVTASQLNASIANIWAETVTLLNAVTVSAESVNTTYLRASSFTFNGTLMSKRSMTVSTPDGDKTIYYLGYVG